MSKVDVLLGLQWGDEGKGKIVDVLTPRYDIIARFQGGPNAGHTLEFENGTYVLHVIPSGIFRKKMNFMGNGMVIDPIKFRKEVASLSKGVTEEEIRQRLFISKGAHIIIPSGILMDKGMEESKGKGAIGSTQCAIGPTYADKIMRRGIRIGHILREDFTQKVQNLTETHIKELEMYISLQRIEEYTTSIAYAPKEKNQSLEERMNEFFEAVEFLKTFNIVDTNWLNEKLNEGHSALAEGAQGSRLDIDLGDGRFVTSSNTTIGGVITGLSIPPQAINKVYGLFKSYCTRVGNGPFPTELDNEIGEELRNIGNERGSTTGRDRRCGWLDLLALKNAIEINGVTELIITKADVISLLPIDSISVCIKYNIDGAELSKLPFELEGEIQPIYQEFKNWKNIEKDGKISEEFNEYCSVIEQYTHKKIKIISTGPDRKDLIVR